MIRACNIKKTEYTVLLRLVVRSKDPFYSPYRGNVFTLYASWHASLLLVLGNLLIAIRFYAGIYSHSAWAEGYHELSNSFAVACLFSSIFGWSFAKMKRKLLRLMWCILRNIRRKIAKILLYLLLCIYTVQSTYNSTYKSYISNTIQKFFISEPLLGKKIAFYAH